MRILEVVVAAAALTACGDDGAAGGGGSATGGASAGGASAGGESAGGGGAGGGPTDAACIPFCEAAARMCAGFPDSCAEDCLKGQANAEHTGCVAEYDAQGDCYAGAQDVCDPLDECLDVTTAYGDCTGQFCRDNPDDPVCA